MLAVLGLSAPACNSPSDSGNASASNEARLREIERRIKDSLPKTEAIAIAQQVDADVVRKVQVELRALGEYLDEPSGKLDEITVNAIEAFQRLESLHDDGLLDAQTLRRLAFAAEKAAAPAIEGEKDGQGRN